MEIKININEERITKSVEDEIVKMILEEHKSENRQAKLGIRDGTDKAIKAYIYKNKDSIIDRVVERATKEITRKGLPKFLENLSDKK